MVFVSLYVLVGVTCLLSGNGKKRTPRIIACVIIFVGMQCLLGLRHIQYGGVDTQIYARDFMRIVNQNYSFVNIFKEFYKDFGFYLFAKLFSLFSTNMNAWLFVCALPFTMGVTWLIYKYSQNMFLSFIMFLSYGFYLYNFQLVRHVFALGLIIIAYNYLEEEKYIKYFIMVIVAMFCHIVALLFFGAYFVRKGRVTFRQIAWIFLGGIAILILSQRSVLAEIFNFIPFLSTGRFSQYATRGGNFSSEFLIQLLFVAISWVYLYRKIGITESIGDGGTVIERKKRKTLQIKISNAKYIPSKQNITLQFNMAVIAALFYLMTIVISESYRMAQYFSLFTILLVPNALKQAPKNQRLFFEAVLILFGIWHFFGGLFVEGSVYNPYVFFWESVQHLY